MLEVRFGAVNRRTRAHPEIDAAILFNKPDWSGHLRLEVAPVGGLRETNKRVRARAKELEKKLRLLNRREARALLDIALLDEIAAAKAADNYVWALAQERFLAEDAVNARHSGT
jgi:hypothetical protein